MHDGQLLDFTHFWEGRISCKRHFLARRDIHNQGFDYLIDIELGYRLAKRGLKVLYNKQAISYMNRRIGFVEFCNRSEAKGRALRQLWELHGTDSRIEKYCSPSRHKKASLDSSADPSIVLSKIKDLERILEAQNDPAYAAELHMLYRSSFQNALSRGFMASPLNLGTIRSSETKPLRGTLDS
jgi:hypothetical protein